MSRPVFHLEEAGAVAVGGTCHLTGTEGHHAATVRRVRVGERIVLTDGRGTALDVEVSEVGRGDVTASVLAAHRDQRPVPHLTVVQAIPKGDRGELAAELLTEVGVDLIVPWQAQRCVSRWQGDRLQRGRERWASAAREAAKQSRRTWWPEVAEPADTTTVATLLSAAELAWILHEGAGTPLTRALDEIGSSSPRSVVLVVGPEGGVSDQELASLTAVGAVPVRLGPTVLRTSTAGAVAAALVQGRTGSWRA